MKVKDIKIDGFPELALVLSHYSAIPLLIREAKKNNVDFSSWDENRSELEKFNDLEISINK